ncbi:MAG: DNA mismatch repair endonuclease MutL [Pygmaiobacter massiliensis]|nr:DNA mismatch repair endonuclease MutL [Pygmaiobacter massiliensis]
MAVIHVLDQHTAELIAAGEVVERPASVVKELVENAIDAGATRIEVAIERGGVGSIQVQDNGTGIEAEYVSTAFIRHATSKIATQADLAAIGTLGFRGEALASISAVSRIELLTCTKQDEFACLYRQEGGKEISIQPSARPVGTTITVRDLFYNVPARMKFLKKDQTEAGYVGDVVLRQALARPDISFSFSKDGKEQFFTPGDGRLRSAVSAVLAKDFSKNLLDVQAQDGQLAVQGVVSAPIAGRGSRSMQYFYVNGRSVQNTTMTAALEAAYKGSLMQGRFPGCVLNVKMPLDRVDVNVHPAKTEVRFANQNEIFDLIYRAVRGSITRPDAPVRHLTLQTDHQSDRRLESAPSSTAGTAGQNTMPAAKTKPSFSSNSFSASNLPVKQNAITDGFLKQTTCTGMPVTVRQNEDWEPMYLCSEPVPFQTRRREAQLDIEKTLQEERRSSSFAEKSAALSFGRQEVLSCPEGPKVPEQSGKTAAVPLSADAALPQTEQPESFHSAHLKGDRQLSITPQPQKPALRYVGEVFRTYILCELENELVLIDKHAAHERILYEKLAADYGTANGQMLLTPVEVTLSPTEKATVLDAGVLLEKAGFEIDDFGGHTVLVRSAPAEAADSDIGALVEEIAHRLTLNAKDTLNEKTEWLLHSVACRGAIKAGDHDRPEALLQLAQQIIGGSVPPFCPHGRPVLLKITKKELEKQFGRLG